MIVVLFLVGVKGAVVLKKIETVIKKRNHNFVAFFQVFILPSTRLKDCSFCRDIFGLISFIISNFISKGLYTSLRVKNYRIFGKSVIRSDFLPIN